MPVAPLHQLQNMLHTQSESAELMMQQTNPAAAAPRAFNCEHLGGLALPTSGGSQTCSNIASAPQHQHWSHAGHSR
jgi:hypothetical protein